MAKIEIIPVTPENYHKCGNVWNMEKTRQTAEWLEEIKSGNRMPYAYTVDGAFLGEIALVKENGDPDYTIPGRRIYVSRLVVKKGYRGQGIGTILVDFIIEKARELGYTELSIGVDKDNEVALHLYTKKGFDEVLFDGEDEDGPYYKLLKKL